MDVTGRTIWVQEGLHLDAGRNLFQPDMEKLQSLAAGVYLLRVSTDQGAATVKVVKQ
jgi:hypothetical protein